MSIKEKSEIIVRQWDYTVAVVPEIIPLIGMAPANGPGGSKILHERNGLIMRDRTS